MAKKSKASKKTKGGAKRAGSKAKKTAPKSKTALRRKTATASKTKKKKTAAPKAAGIRLRKLTNQEINAGRAGLARYRPRSSNPFTHAR